MSQEYGGACRDHEPRVLCSLEDNKQVELEDPLDPPKNGDNHDLDENDGEGTSSCFVCNKNFRSLHALFGHMRCHPNRPWRGIHPPPRAKTTSGSTSTLSTEYKYTLVASGANSCESFPCWITTRKRRQKRMMLAHVGRSFHSPNLSEKLGIEDSSQTEEAGNESSGLHKRQKILLEHEFDLESTKERKMEEEWQCKNTHGSLPDQEQLQEIGRKSTEKMNTGIVDLDTSLMHFTQICNKTLLMDQGLGIHKRTHWQGLAEAAFSQGGSLGEASPTTGGRVLDFDLNDLPPMEE
ncbi:hypothetical protein AAG906_005798 [Vitis piasezkii]